MVRHDFDRTEVDARFRILAGLLAENPLPTERGGTRVASASEFMLMHVKPAPLEMGEVTGYKHRDSRNYVFVITLFRPPLTEYTLHVPRTPEPFMRGTFDVFEVPAGWQSVDTSVSLDEAAAGKSLVDPSGDGGR